MFTRSTKISLKFCNAEKRASLDELREEYRRVLNEFVHLLWDVPHLFPFVDTKREFKVNSWMTATVVQACSKQASSIVRGERKLARRQRRQPSFPELKSVPLELDRRCCKLESSQSARGFDLWMKIECFDGRTRGRKILVPIRRTRHFNSLAASMQRRVNGCLLTPDACVVRFESEAKPREAGDVLGVDVGAVDVWADSRGSKSLDVRHPHKWTMSKVLTRLARRRRGSKGFRRAQNLRKNFVGWSVNRLSLDGVRELRLEDLREMKRGKRTSSFLKGWSYPQILSKLQHRAEEQSVSVSFVRPRDTSRKCSACGAVDARSRAGKSFKCVACGHAADADSNAALNISRETPLASRMRGAYSPSCSRKDATTES